MLNRTVPTSVAFGAISTLFALLAFCGWRSYEVHVKAATIPPGQGSRTYEQYCTSCHTDARTLKAMQDKAGGSLPWDEIHAGFRQSKIAAGKHAD